MPLFHLPILDVLPQVVADGSQGGVHLHTEVTPEAYGCFVHRALLLKTNESNMVNTALLSSPFSFDRMYITLRTYQSHKCLRQHISISPLFDQSRCFKTSLITYLLRLPFGHF